MHVTIVDIHVRPECLDAFVEATLANSSASQKEPGNLRFDVLQSKDDPCHFLLYEAYETLEAVAAHKETAHYKTWSEVAPPLMAEPRTRATYTGLTANS
jgi:autoinducer 2-degrading protein